MDIPLEERNFLLRFFGAFIPLYLIVLAAPIRPLLDFIASTVSFMLPFIGTAATVQANVISAGAIKFEIVNECSSLVMIALFISLLFAAKWESKGNRWVVLAQGALILFLFNLLRLAFTISIGAHFGEDALQSVHFVLWMVDAAAVVALWALMSGMIRIVKGRIVMAE